MEENETDMRDSIYYDYARNDYICVCGKELAIMLIYKVDRNWLPEYFSNNYGISTSVDINYVNVHCPICGERIQIAAPPGHEIVKTLGVLADK